MTRPNTERRLVGPMGCVLVVDPGQVFPDDPGRGTPLIVAYKGATGTYHCVLDNMELVPDRGEIITLPTRVAQWLESDAVIQYVNDIIPGYL